MGDMGDMAATNTWKIYLAMPDIDAAVAAVAAAGGSVVAPPMPVADLGVQSIIIDPTGANLGIWQPGTHPGFTELNEHGAPSWFELQTADQPAALAFYHSAFGWDFEAVTSPPGLDYSVALDPSGEGWMAGVMDASSFMGDGPAQWAIYWEVDDVDATVAAASAAGGDVVQEPEDTPYGVLAGLTDPAGALFKLRRSPAG
jgi:predicted enzyme related to lactoylglutathione lyase